MDLFYGTTVKENVIAFKKDLKQVALKYDYDFGKKRIHIANGNLENIGNCILVVGPPLKLNDKHFQDKYSNYLFKTALDFKMPNTFLVSCFPIPLERISKTNIKEFNPWMEKLVDIFRPKLVVVLGEDAQFSFVKRKHILRDYHGKIITKTVAGIDVLLSYTMDYFIDLSEFEDGSYKDFIRNADWTIIKKYYDERIK